MADSTIWQVAAHLLATVNISNPIDTDGNPMTLDFIDHGGDIVKCVHLAPVYCTDAYNNTIAVLS